MKPAIAAAAVVLALAQAVPADMITLIHEGYGSRSIDGAPFGAAAPVHFVITAIVVPSPAVLSLAPITALTLTRRRRS